MFTLETSLDWLIFIFISGLAIARLSRLVMNEESFLWTGYIVRHLVGMRYKAKYNGDNWVKVKEQTLQNENLELPDEINNIFQLVHFARIEKLGLYHLHPNSYLGRIFSCIFCISIWIAIFAVFSYIFLPMTPFMEILWLLFVVCAVSQISIMAYKRTQNKNS